MNSKSNKNSKYNNKGTIQLSKLSMHTINNNLQILSKLAASKKHKTEFASKEISATTTTTTQDNIPVSPISSSLSPSSELLRLFDTTFKAICDLEVLEAKLNLKLLDLEKALLNLIKKLIDFEQVNLYIVLYIHTNIEHSMLVLIMKMWRDVIFFKK